MADTYLTLRPTDAGLDGIVKSMYGGSITFTKMCLGNGVPADPEHVEEMVNVCLTIEPLTGMTLGDKEVILTGYTTTDDVDAGFYAYEIGVYAEDENENEYLFAYSYNPANVDYYPDSSSGRTQEVTLTVVVAVGDAENVDAILIEGDAYAPKADFEAHVADRSNPHQVTKTQVGLGNVDNVSVQNMAPTFSQAADLDNIASGEKLPVLFGKIAKAISGLISHLSSRNNPHGVTPTQIGAAALQHYHSTADINSGILGINRGGTGANNYIDACANLHALREYTRVVPDSNSRNGAYMITGGLLIQWGDCTAPANTDSYEVTFPLAFKDTNYAVMATVEGGLGVSTDVTIRVTRYSSEKFKARCFNNGTPTYNIQASYIAVGFWTTS